MLGAGDVTILLFTLQSTTGEFSMIFSGYEGLGRRQLRREYDGATTKA
jgi:hypothetical protein